MTNHTTKLSQSQKQQLISAWRHLEEPAICTIGNRKAGFRFQLAVIQYQQRWYQSPKFIFAESDSECEINHLKLEAEKVIKNWVRMQ